MASEITIKARTANGKMVRKIAKNTGFNQITKFISEGVRTAVQNSPARNINKLAENMGRKMSQSISRELAKIPMLTLGLVNSAGPARTNRRIGPTNILGTAGTDDFSKYGRFSNLNKDNIANKYVSSATKTLEWKALAKSTVQSKLRKKRRHPDSFFRDKDNLVKALKRFSSDRFIAKTGGVTVQYKPTKSKKNTRENLDELVGNFTITLLPKMKGRALPFLRTGNWSESTRTGEFEKMFFGNSTVTKLTNGGRSSMRPLLQPVVSAVLAFRVPSAIIRGAQRSVIGSRSTG